MAAILERIDPAVLDALPPGFLSTDPDVLAGHETDISGRFHGRAAALARLRDAAEVRRRSPPAPRPANRCAPRAARPGWSAARSRATARSSLVALDQVGEVDRAAAQIAVGAGATLEQVQDAPRRAGLEFPLADGATISRMGGLLKDNAGLGPAGWAAC